MDFSKVTNAIKDVLIATKDKAIELKDKASLRKMIDDAVEDGVLTDEEKDQITEAVLALGLNKEKVFIDVEEKLKKVQYRLEHLEAIKNKIASLALVDGQVGQGDYDELISIAAEIDIKADKIEKQLFEAHGNRCLMAIHKPELEEKIVKASANGKIGELENISIKKYASEYGYTDAETYSMIAEALKNVPQE